MTNPPDFLPKSNLKLNLIEVKFNVTRSAKRLTCDWENQIKIWFDSFSF